MGKIDELKKSALTIKTNELPNSNTATLVGGHLEKVNEVLEDLNKNNGDYNVLKRKVSELEQKVKDIEDDGVGLSTRAINLIGKVLKACVTTSDVNADIDSLIEELGNGGGGSGDSGGEEQPIVISAPIINISDYVVSITSRTEGANIYYTTNGDEPTNNSTLYSGAFKPNDDCTIKTVAYKDGYYSSVVSSIYQAEILSSFIDFDDALVEQTMVEKYDTDGDGRISVEEANLVETL